MKHRTLKDEDSILWEVRISRNGCLNLIANGETAVLIDRNGKLIICKQGTELGLIYSHQVFDNQADPFPSFRS